jgi:lipopolysaccharide/colanic/teichoic acid biosynthesis glycosyltransferase
VFDVAMIVLGAIVASQIRFDDISQRSFYPAFVAFAAALALALFPMFGVYESWRGRSKAALTGRVALSWLIVQVCAMALMFSLHRIDFVSRLWFVYWTGMAGAAMIAGRLATYRVLARVRNAGLNLQQVAVVGCGEHCDAIVRKIDTVPAAGFRATLALFEGSVMDLLGVPTINLATSPLPPKAVMQKDIFDRLFAAGALLAVSPILLACAIAVKLSSSGPVFFKQNRKGADGRVFTIFKFRTMRLHAQKAGVLEQAKRGDPRITRVGGFLRRTSLDELPQFINVLRGEMSVVGPRPHALEHDDLYQKVVSGYIHRYRIKPGITGWAQVNGFRGETDRIEKMEGRVAHDLYYLGNWSFGLDVKIIFATIFKGLRHTNAY